MINFQILKEASDVDGDSVIKVAGVTNRLLNWFHQLTSQEYRDKVKELKNDSNTVASLLPELGKHVKKLQKAISEADVYVYEKELKEVKYFSELLNRELEQLNLGATFLIGPKETEEKTEKVVLETNSQDSEAVVEEIAPANAPTTTVSDEKPAVERTFGRIMKPYRNLDYINTLPFIFSQNSKVKVKTQLDMMLADDNDPGSQFLKTNSEAQKNFIVFLEEAIKNGIVDSIYPMNKDGRSNQHYIEAITAPFSIPKVALKFKAVVLLNEIPGKSVSFIRIKKLSHEVIKTSGSIGILNKIANFDSVVPVPGLGNKSPEFVEKLITIGNRLNIDPSFLATVMSAESGLNHEAVNRNGGATGLIQFMPRSAKSLGTSTEELRTMSDVDQLDYVERFFKPFAGKIKSAGDLYIATFLPAFVGHPAGTILGQRGNHNAILPNSKLTFDQIYNSNSGLDLNLDGTITVGDVQSKANNIYAGAIKNIPTYSHKNLFSDSHEYLTSDEDEFGQLDSFLNTAESLNDVVKLAILKDILPNHKFLINIFSTADKAVEIKYASVVSESLNDLNINSKLQNNDNEVVIICEAMGDFKNNKNVIKSICLLASDCLKYKYDIKINSLVEVYKNNSFNKISSSTINISETQFIKIAAKIDDIKTKYPDYKEQIDFLSKRSVASTVFGKNMLSIASEKNVNTFSSTMRDLNDSGNKEKLLSFLKTFKNNFDQNYLSGADTEECEIKSLEEAVY